MSHNRMWLSAVAVAIYFVLHTPLVCICCRIHNLNDEVFLCSIRLWWFALTKWCMLAMGESVAPNTGFFRLKVSTTARLVASLEKLLEEKKIEF